MLPTTHILLPNMTNLTTEQEKSSLEAERRKIIAWLQKMETNITPSEKTEQTKPQPPNS